MRKFREVSLAVLRIAVGTHLFLSGLVKVIDPGWTALSFLDGSYGFFKWLATKPFLLQLTDQLNIWVLLLTGIALVAGVFKRIAALLALGLLVLYYVAYPPINLNQLIGSSGPEFIVNPLLIEILVLLLIIAYSDRSKAFSGRNLLKTAGSGRAQVKEVAEGQVNRNSRRDILRSLVSVPFLGLISIPFLKTGDNTEVDAVGGATVSGSNSAMPGYQRLKYLDLTKDVESLENREKMPFGTIGKLRISRLIAGNDYLSNDFYGQHSIHLQQLARIYFSEERVFFTLKSMEVQGINAIILSLKNVIDHKLMDYFEQWQSQLHWIAEVTARNPDKFDESVRRTVEYGADAILISREACEDWLENGNPEFIDQAIDIVKNYQVPVGIGAISNESIEYTLQRKLPADFFLKSFHNVPERNSGNFYCDNTEYFSQLVAESDIPWIAAKTSAGGYINPYDGYKFSIEKGASFICDDMFDIQVKSNIDSFQRATQ